MPSSDAEKGTAAPPHPQMSMQQKMMKIPPDFEKAEVHGVRIRICLRLSREQTKLWTWQCLSQPKIQYFVNAAVAKCQQ